MADTAALVVQLSAQLTKFERDMKGAVGMAERATKDIEDSFGKMNPSFKGSFFGNLFSDLVQKGIAAAKDAIAELIQRFEDLAKTAKYTGQNLNWVYGLQEAFKESGSSADDLNKVLYAINEQMSNARRGNQDTPLGKLFDANNVRISQDLGENVKRIADIIQNMDPRDRLQVIRDMGLPPGTVEAFERGGDALLQMAEDAAKVAPNLEAIRIQGEVLKSTFDAVKDSLAEWAKTASFDVLEAGLTQLISLAETFANLLKGGILEGAADQVMRRWQEVGAAFEDMRSKAQQAVQGDQQRLRVDRRYTAVNPFGLGGGGGGAEQHQFDRQIESIEKHTAKLQADAATVFESAQTQEEYRIQVQLTEAALSQYGEVTDEVRDKIAALSERAGQAKQKLAEQQQTLQRLQSASQQVGSALSTAFADAIVEGKSLNDVLSGLIKTLEKAAINQLFSNLFSPGAAGGISPIGNLFSGLFGKQSGGPIMAGHPYLVGEHGPELVVPSQSGMVVPNDALTSGGIGTSVVYSPAIDARGASVEAVARLAQIMEQDRAAFAARTVAVIQQARRGRVRGL